MINKIKQTKKETRIRKAIMIKELRDSGLKIKEISNKLSLCERQISDYLKIARTLPVTEAA